MKIVYCGSDVHFDSFRYLCEHHEILALYTYHNDEDYFMEYQIVEEASRRNIPVYYGILDKQRISDYFIKEGCQLIFSAEYDKILDLPKNLDDFKAVNVHCSLLPKGRSYYPIECGFEKDERYAGVTMHQMESAVDSGAIIFQENIDTIGLDSIDVYIRCGQLVKEMTIKLMSDFDRFWNEAKPQEGKLPYWKRPSQDKMNLVHEMNISESLEMFRKYNKMVEASIDGKRYYVVSMSASEVEIDNDCKMLGHDYCLYKVCDGHLRLTLLEVKDE